MRVLIAGGGTGGHVIPALAIAQKLRELYSADVQFVGTARGIETRLVPNAGYALHLIDVGQLNRVSLAMRLKTLTALPMSILAAVRLLRSLKPDIVLGVGGYASGPAAIAAVLLRTPLVLFEPNVVPGFVNRRVARFAAAAAVHFEETGAWFRRYEVTGVPVREAFFNLPEPIPGKAPTLLLFGGSQGARALNRALVGALPELRRQLPNLQIIHQTGQRDYDEISARYAELGIPAEVSAFIDDMPRTFAAADVIVCRSGASTVAEVAAAAKAAIFVPLPTAADDHQLRNAESLDKRNAAILIHERDLTPERLSDAVVQMFADGEQLKRIGQAARALAHRDAAAHIARILAEFAAKHS